MNRTKQVRLETGDRPAVEKLERGDGRVPLEAGQEGCGAAWGGEGTA